MGEFVGLGHLLPAVIDFLHLTLAVDGQDLTFAGDQMFSSLLVYCLQHELIDNIWVQAYFIRPSKDTEGSRQELLIVNVPAQIGELSELSL